MRLISEEYRSLNNTLHAENSKYGTSGQHYLDDITRLAKTLQTQDILDYGCGKGTLAMNLPFAIKQYDPAVSKHSVMPAPADLVVCTDVLEHIEPDCLDAVLTHLESLTKRIGFFTIHTGFAKKRLADGRNAHLIVEPPRWWVSKLYEHFEIMNLSRSGKELIVVVEMKGISTHKESE